MLNAVEQDPTLYGGWQNLADWSRERRDNAGYLKYSEQMMRLEPFGEVSLGYYAEALMINEKRDTAKEVFQRAYEIEPAYDFAGISLYDLQVEDEEWTAAEQTLDSLEVHTPGPFVDARRVQVAAHNRNLPTAREALFRVCTHSAPNHDEWPLQHSFRAMSSAGWLKEMDDIISEVVQQPDCIPEAGNLWSVIKMERGQLDAESQLKGLVEKHPAVGHRAVYMWIKDLVENGNVERFRTFVRINEPWLRADTQSWGSVGYGWTLSRDWPGSVPWADDWKKHPDAEPWMLVNTSEILRAVGRQAEGAEVNRHSLSLEPHHAFNLHELWLASDAALAGEFDEAADRLSRVDPEGFDDDYFLLFILVRAILNVTSAPPQERAGVLAEFRQHLTEFLKEYKNLPTEPARKVVLKQTLKYLASKANVSFKLWAKWKQLKL